MAYNLAIGIKNTAPEIPITLVKSGSSISHLLDWQLKVFDNIVELDEKRITHEGKVNYLQAKTLIYELSPYEKTIYLDVDMIWSPYKNINDLFQEGLQFAVRGEGVCEWVDKELLFSTYKINHWYDISSEFIFFDRSDTNKKVFEDAYRYYNDNTIPVVSAKEKKEGKKGVTMFAGSKPDELPFGIAVEKNNIKLKCPYQPSYWQPQYFSKKLNDLQIQKDFYLISTGGANIQTNIQRIYNNLTKYYYYRMGIKKTPYQLIAKSKILPERKLI